VRISVGIKGEELDFEIIHGLITDILHRPTDAGAEDARRIEFHGEILFGFIEANLYSGAVLLSLFLVFAPRNRNETHSLRSLLVDKPAKSTGPIHVCLKPIRFNRLPSCGQALLWGCAPGPTTSDGIKSRR
jgi:hypothetical protein